MSSWFSGLFGNRSNDDAKRSYSASAEDTWRKLYAPGTNPNLDKQGSNYYDTASKTDPTTWDMILKSESLRKKSFSDLDKNQDGFIDKQELTDALKTIPKADAGRLIREADTNNDGKIDRKEYRKVLDKYFGAA